jgi:site-specific recombinase XerD
MEAVDGALARHLLPAGVRHLDEAQAVFEAMIEGWSRQQQSRMLKPATIKARRDLVRRFESFNDAYPWHWEPTDVEAFTASLLSGEGVLAHSTVRRYQNDLRLFCEYLVDGRYGWSGHCQERFGSVPTQVFHEWNTVEHLAQFEGRPEVRGLDHDELMALFDHADQRVSDIMASGRKGSLAAFRDSALFKVAYAFGLRRAELVGLDLVDLRHNPEIEEFGRYGALLVRRGKSQRGGPPKRRTVLLIPEFDWARDVLEQYVTEVRPRFDPGAHPALWVTERRGRINRRDVDRRFAALRDAVDLPPELHPHCLRHSYASHLVEYGYPERFIQEQLGHSYASTTAIYANVSNDYKNQVLARALHRLSERKGGQS